jgi:AMMECR1 domain-containing protein
MLNVQMKHKYMSYVAYCVENQLNNCNILKEYDTVARADNYFAEYRMLFLRRHSNERDMLRGSCIDVIKSRLRKSWKAPASSRF